MFALIVGFAALAVFMNRGLFHMVKARQEVQLLKAANDALDQKNRALYRRVRRLETDPGYIGYLARRELGLVSPGEIIFRFPRGKDARGAEPVRR